MTSNFYDDGPPSSGCRTVLMRHKAFYRAPRGPSERSWRQQLIVASEPPRS